MSSDSESDLSLKNLLKSCNDDGSSEDESLSDSILDKTISDESPHKSEPLKEKDTESKDKNIPNSFTRRSFLLDCVVPRILFPDEEKHQQPEEPTTSSKAILRQMCQFDVNQASLSTTEHTTTEKKNRSASNSSNEDSSSDLESIPKRLMQPDMCKLCDVVFTSERQATSHYDGKPHHKKGRHYIENKIFEHERKKESSRLKGANSIVKHSSEEEQWECTVCDIRLNSALAARAHYAGKSHKWREEKYSRTKKNYRDDDLRLNRKRHRQESEERRERHYKRHHHHHHHHHHRHHSDSS